MKTFKQFLDEDLRRAALMGGATVAAGAITGSLVGLGPIAGGMLAGAHYALRDARKDYNKKRGEWNYNKKRKT